MLDLTTIQQDALNSNTKKVTWLFNVIDGLGTSYYWATAKHSGSYNVWATGVQFSAYNHWIQEENIPHDFKIIDFNGIQLIRNKAEMGIVAPNDLTFSVVNSGNALRAADFDDGQVRLTLLINNVVIRRWRFHIRQVEHGYQKLRFVCEDFLQQFLKGYYPNTRLVRDIFPSNDVDNGDGVCVPVPFGTAYVPLRSVYIDEAITLDSTVIEAVASTNGSRCKFRITVSGSDRFSDFESLRYITVSGFTESSNNGVFLVLFSTESELELSESAGLVTEQPGDSITITQGSRYYILGDPDYTFDVDEVRSPRAWGRRSTWDDATELIQWAAGIQWNSRAAWYSFYTFIQSTMVDNDGYLWRVMQPIIADSDNDGWADSPGVWRSGDVFLDMPTKFNRSDTSALTNPADVILFVLRDWGMSVYKPALISLKSFADAKATFSGWGLSWNGALWYKELRPKLLSRLLNMCNSNLIIDEQVELKVNSKLSQRVVTSADILKRSDIGEGTFTYQDLRRQFIDNCGYVAWQETGEAQDRFVKTLVPAHGSTKTQISREIVEMPWVSDSQDVQALATLYYQRKLLKVANIGFSAKASLLGLNPGDAITVDGQNYGGGEVLDETGATWPTSQPLFSFYDGKAFFLPYGVNLTDYAKGIGYADSLGQELMTNGDNEVAAAVFTANDAAIYSTMAADSGQAHTGTRSTKITGTGANYYCGWTYQETTLSRASAGHVYRIEANVYLPSGGHLNTILMDAWGDSGALGNYTGFFDKLYTSSSTVTDQWVNIVHYVRVVDWLRVRIYCSDSTDNTNNSEFFYIDDVSIKEVLDDCRYQVRLHDTEGKTAIGYIQAADSIEYGNELATNGNNNAAKSTFDEDSDGNCDSALDVGTGNPGNSTKLTCNAAGAGGSYIGRLFRDTNNSKLTYGKRYRISVDIYIPSGQGFSSSCGLLVYPDYKNSGIYHETYTSTTDAYVTLTQYFTAGNDTVIWVLAYEPGGVEEGDLFYFDNLSIKEITHVGETGVAIVEAADSHVQNWKRIEDGFNMNDTSYTFEVTDAYDVVIDSMQINKDASINFSCSKYSCELDDFDDISPAAITITNDDTASEWAPMISGPLTDEDLAIDTFKAWSSPYLIVGPTAGAGQYTSIQAALNALKDSNHTGIYIKNGEYKLTVPVYLPDRNINIVGESRNSIIYNSPGQNGFDIGNRSNTYKFSDLTIKSLNTSSFSYMIKIYGTAYYTNIARLIVEHVDFILNHEDSDLNDAEGDLGIYGENGSGELNIRFSSFLNGRMGIYMGSTLGQKYIGSRVYDGNIFDNQLYPIYDSPLAGGYADSLIIVNNTIKNFRHHGVYVSAGYSKIINNSITIKEEMLDVSAITTKIGLAFGSGNNSIISGNSVRMNFGNLVLNGPFRGISVGFTNTHIIGNQVYIKIISSEIVNGIVLLSATDSIISGNKVDFSNTDTTQIHYGITLDSNSHRNVISGNQIDMVNNDAKDVGIHIDGNNNQGGDNITYNCGTGIDDDGTGNAVTGKDV